MAQSLDVAKQARWLELIHRWQRSPISIREFCQRHQISEASFFSWRRVLRERGLLEAGSVPKASAETPAFVKVTALDAESASAIELVLSSQRVLRVRSGFDAEMLLQLVRLLEERAC